MYKLLDKIDNPGDLKKLNEEELAQPPAAAVPA